MKKKVNKKKMALVKVKRWIDYAMDILEKYHINQEIQ